MLKRVFVFMCAIVCGCALLSYHSISQAEGCGSRVDANGVFSTSIRASLGCGYSTPGSSSGGSSQYQSGVDHNWDYDYGDAAAADSCYNMAGERVDCWYKDYWWSPANDMWCKAADDRFRASNQDDHIDAAGNYYGTMYRCANPGTYRPWDKDDLLRDHSPSGCEHTYMKTNTLGDKTSRYLVTAAVTWRVTWSATNGQSGAFTTDIASTEPASIHVGEIRTVNVPPPKNEETT